MAIRKDANPPKFKIKRGDFVEVIAGNDKGARGEVLEVRPKEHRVVVEGVNIRKKHQSRQDVQGSQQQTQPGIIQFEAPIHISNVMLVDPVSDEPTRVSIRRDEEGRRIRVAKKSGVDID